MSISVKQAPQNQNLQLPWCIQGATLDKILNITNAYFEKFWEHLLKFYSHYSDHIYEYFDSGLYSNKDNIHNNSS